MRPKLDPFIGIIDKILADDKSRPKKQQHTSKRIFERLRDEHGFTGGITIVKDYVAGWRQRPQEMFVPLVHPPGHAQADFGEALAVIGGVERKIHFFAFDLPHSDAMLRGGLSGGDDGGLLRRPRAGVRVLRRRAAVDPLRQHEDRGGPHPGRRQAPADARVRRAAVALPVRGPLRPAGKGNDKGKVEGLVGYARRNFLVPIPVFESFEALNAHLLDCCRKRMSDRLRGHTETIGERLIVKKYASDGIDLPSPNSGMEGSAPETAAS